VSNKPRFRFRTSVFGKIYLQVGEDRRLGLEEDGPEYVLWRDAKLEDLSVFKQIKLEESSVREEATD